MSLLESKISSELASSELIVGPIRTSTNNQMFIYGDTDFTEYIITKATLFALEHAVHLDEEDRLTLYRLLKLNTTNAIPSLIVVPPTQVLDTFEEDVDSESS